MPNYNIKGTGIEVSGELRSYVERRLLHAEKFLKGDSVARTDVELEYQAMRDGDHYRAEFTTTTSGGLYRAENWGVSMQAAIDLGLGELTLKLGREKKKRLHILRRGAHKVKEYLRGWRNKV